MTKNIEIHLYTSEILHDIENVAFLTGKANRTGDNGKAVSLMQASEDPEDSDKIMRSVGTAYSNLFMVMSDYISDDTSTAGNLMPERETDTVINLIMPSNFKNSVVDTIASASHDYVVSLALSEWFAITCKTDADSYAAKASASLALVAQSLEERERPRRISPTPGPQVQYPIYIGSTPAAVAAPNENDLRKYCSRKEAGGRQLVTSVGALVNEKICYAYPYIWGALESIRDDNNFEYIYSFDKSVITLSDGDEYYCYILSEAITKEQKTTLHFT